MRERDRSAISAKFGSILGERIQCRTCKKSKAKFSEELCLSVPLVKGALPPDFQANSDSNEEVKFDKKDFYNQSIKEGLAQFTNRELLDDDQKLHCMHCKSMTRVSKKTELWELPEILVINVKRFVFDENAMSF